MVGMFLRLGSGYHGHRKRKQDRQSDHDADLTHYLAPSPHASKTVGMVSGPTRVVGLIITVVQIMGRLQGAGFSELFAMRPKFFRQVV
jgi:hypothetical protein